MKTYFFSLICSFIFIGTAFGQHIEWDTKLYCSQNGSNFGTSIADAGDINGDGFNEILIGASLYENGESSEGRVFVYYGSAVGLDTITYSTLEINQAYANFGISLSGLGDINNDGYADIIIGANSYDNGQTNEGAAFIFLGAASGVTTSPAYTLEANQASSNFGIAVSGGNDFNSDGFPDFIVGANFYDAGQTNEGRVYVYMGSAGGISITPSYILENNISSQNFGTALSGIGDYNGDGFNDFAVGASGLSERVYVYFGSSTGINTVPVFRVGSGDFGKSISPAGDVNNDGFADFCAGAPNYTDVESEEGAAFLYIGNAAGTFYPLQMEGNQVNADYGVSVSGGADINDDGKDDLIIGAPFFDNGQSNEGSAFIYFGDSTFGFGINPFVYNTLENNVASKSVGSVVKIVNDLNGDLRSDILISNNSNEVFVYYNAGCMKYYYQDLDFDGCGNPDSIAISCTTPIGYVINHLDCDDLNNTVHVGAMELNDGLDNNCDGIVDNFSPNLEWQKTVGGIYNDLAYSISQVSSGEGFIVGGFSGSPVSGDKTLDSTGNWILRFTPLGELVWQKILESGGIAAVDMGTNTTADGGIIATVFSNEVIGALSISKLNEYGELSWQKLISASGTHRVGQYAFQTSDGGYIIGLFTTAGVSGDKTEPSFGDYDWWVLKLDALGNIVWQRTIGGSGIDELNSIIECDNGGYVITGNSFSGVSGLKTEMSILDDIWVVKLDESGNILWQNTLRASSSEYESSIVEAPNGDYYLVIPTTSGVGYEKLAPNIPIVLTPGVNNISLNKYDIWLVVLDSIGNFSWDTVYGGTDFEGIATIKEFGDEQFCVVTSSRSERSGTKTENAVGLGDYWIFVIDTLGNVLWDKTIGGFDDDVATDFSQTQDGGIIVAGYSDSNLGGDKSEDSRGYSDYWILKFGSICEPMVEICNSIDDDCNGLIDDGAAPSISITAAGPTIFCQGGSVELGATYTGTSLQWKKGASDIPGATNTTYIANSKGVYSCVTTSICGTATSASITVTVNKNPNASISASGPTSFCAGGSVTLTEVPSGGCSYQWYKGASPIAGATATTYVAASAGNYKCRVTKTATGCYKNSNTIGVSIVCKESEFIESNTEPSVNIFPNPTNSTLFISIIANEYIEPYFTINVSNALGEDVMSVSSTNATTEIDVSVLASGVYFITVPGIEAITKFIKQ